MGACLTRPREAMRLTADDRLAASFQQIVDFVQANDRLPEVGSPDIGEATLAARLNSIRVDRAKADALRPIDSLGTADAAEGPRIH